jgi:hypothetical protein
MPIGPPLAPGPPPLFDSALEQAASAAAAITDSNIDLTVSILYP